MDELETLFENNRRWAEERQSADPDFFKRLSGQQNPKFLWIGCSDSRIPANQVIGLDPGEVFVHRNVANQVAHGDLNCLSVIQYAVEYLHVEHIIVCGHYGCGGVLAAMEDRPLGICDHWIGPIRDIHAAHLVELKLLTNPRARYDRLVELNVMEQVRRVCHTTVLQQAWSQGSPLTVHGWVYSLENGLLRDLKCSMAGPETIPSPYRMNFPRAETGSAV